MTTANTMLHHALSQAGLSLPKARRQLRLLQQSLRAHMSPSSLNFWRQRPRQHSLAPPLSLTPRPLCTTTIRWMAAACNDAQFTPAAAPTKPPGPRTLRTIQLIEHHALERPLVRLRLSGRLADVCDELDRLAALESKG